ncbi:MbnP family protein [Flavobacterium sp.]
MAQTASTTIPIQFKLKFQDVEIVKDQTYTSTKGDTLSIETFKCYISNVKLEYVDQSFSHEKDSYHLLNLDSINSFQFYLPRENLKPIAKITFNIGIDSLMNTAGIRTGTLDPINGMYWAWQSGYINFKIEGRSSSCSTRHNKFQFHVGGYLYPNYALRKKEINVTNNNTIVIDINLDAFFNKIDLSLSNSVMIPGKKAMKLADLSMQLFEIE